MRNNEEAERSNVTFTKGLAWGVWLGTLGTAIFAGKMWETMFGNVAAGIGIWIFLATCFTVYSNKV